MEQAHAQLLGQQLSGLAVQPQQSQAQQANRIFIRSLAMEQTGTGSRSVKTTHHKD